MNTTPPVRTTGRSNWSTLIFGVVTVVVVANAFALFGLRDPGLVENRTLATMPDWPRNLADWKSLASHADAFLTDQFPPRAYMISYLNYARYRMGYSGSKKIIVGKDGWLFYDGDTHLAALAGKQWLSSGDFSAWVEGFRQREQYVQARGARFYLLLAPVKEDIYPEHRPSWMPEKRVDTEIDEIERKAKAANIDRIVDPRNAILAEKNQQKLWDEFDTHWTGLGAYIAYRQLMQRMQKDNPELAPLPQTYFSSIETRPKPAPRDLSLMLGVADFEIHDRVSYASNPIHDPAKTIFLSERHDWTAPQVLLTEATGGRTLLLLRDSFATELLPLLKPHFSRIVMAHVQDGFFRQDLIEKFHPDVVLVEIIETGARFAMNPMPSLNVSPK